MVLPARCDEGRWPGTGLTSRTVAINSVAYAPIAHGRVFLLVDYGWRAVSVLCLPLLLRWERAVLVGASRGAPEQARQERSGMCTV